MNVKEINGITYELDDKNKTAKVIQSPKAKGDIFIPKSIQIESNDYIILSIEKNSFKDNKDIQSISFAKDSAITYLGEDCFHDTNINKIIIPDSVTKFGNGAFSWCNFLVSVEITPNSQLTTFGKFSFSFSKITNLYIPKLIETLEEDWVSNAFDLNTIEISPENKNFTLIDDKVLLCKSNKLSENFDVIKFASKDINHFTIPSYVSMLDYYSFCHCINLQKIDFSQNTILKVISGRAFRNCKQLKSVSLPSSVVTIGFEAFYNCRSLEKVFFGENSQLKQIDTNAFYFCNFTSFDIPEKVESLVSSTFSFCHRLSKITIPNNSKLTTLGPNIFLHTNFQSIIFPENIHKIDYCGLGECKSLVSAEFLSDEMILGSNFFRNSQTLFVVSFPNADAVQFAHTPFLNGSEICKIFCKPKAKILFT